MYQPPQYQTLTALSAFLTGALLSPLIYHTLDLAHSIIALFIRIIQL